MLENRAKRPGTDHYGGCDTPQIGEHLRAGGFDALLTLGWNLKSSVQAIRAARRLGLPVLVRGDSQVQTPRSTAKRLAKAIAYPVLLRAFDAALYVGSRSKAYYLGYHYPAERLFFSPHCVDTARFAAGATPAARVSLRRELGLSESDRVVLFAGKLLPFKRPLDVVDACARLAAQGPRVSVLVAGAGELGEALRARAEMLNVPIHRLGFQNQSRMPAIYAAADVLMLPSDAHETWGLVCNEALASGRPILVSDAAGCAGDLAGDGEAGARFPMGNVQAAALALARLLDAPRASEAIARKNAAFSLAAAADGVEAALQFVSRRGRSPRKVGGGMVSVDG
jgi:glycosyltransferase involved in cell wall biosynthesis